MLLLTMFGCSDSVQGHGHAPLRSLLRRNRGTITGLRGHLSDAGPPTAARDRPMLGDRGVSQPLPSARAIHRAQAMDDPPPVHDLP
ncbi:MAG: hypothetical protein E6J90_28410 [Deltaproteobacteria bacterium]|nr:MAG: hypothetical protein E6J90_28410 [Deltaproteobacteria bacterium]